MFLGSPDLSDEERVVILKDFPKPNCPAMEVPRLDDDVRKQLKCRGKDPQFGVEKTVVKVVHLHWSH